MLSFLQAGGGTALVLLVVAFVVFLAIRRMVLDKKAGIGSCGQKCANCSKMQSCSNSKKEETSISKYNNIPSHL